MAEAVTGPEEPERDETAEPSESRELERVSRELEPRGSLGLELQEAHERKFRLAFAALAGVAVAAIAGALIFLAAGRPPKPPAWSTWHPSDNGSAGIQQIADHVAPNYRLPGGRQLVAVRGGPLEIAGLPATVILQSASSISPVPGKGALYILCGLGSRCSIKGGRPSTERHLLLRREALELALYTFRYVKDVNQVVVLLPPPPGQPPSQAMYFRPNEVKPLLGRPLRNTLPSPPPSLSSLKQGADAAVLQRLTDRDLFNFDVQQGQDASVFLVLNPLGIR